MKVRLCYPIPFDGPLRNEFMPYVDRFVSSFKIYPPGDDLELRVVCLDAPATDELRAKFTGIDCEFDCCLHRAYDTGANQHIAEGAKEAFQIGMSTRGYFHRAGAVDRMRAMREKFGRGLYGTSCSREESVHVRTNFYGMDSQDLAAYPFKLTEFGYGRVFEVGDANYRFSLLNWCEQQGIPSVMVYWDGVYERKRDWFRQPNTFRKGDQSNLLIWERATDYYRNSSPSERDFLNRLAYGGWQD